MKFKVGDVVHVNEKFGSDVNGVIYPDVTEVGSFAVITEIENGGYCIRMNRAGAEYFASHEMLDAVQLRVQRTCAQCGASMWANGITVKGVEYCTACGASR